MAVLSSCTSAGVECGLIGKWEYVNSTSLGDITTTYEITSDDKFKTTVKTSNPLIKIETGSSEVTITAVKDHTITTKNNGVEADIEYKDLGCDSVKFKVVGEDWLTYKKVF